MCGTRILGMRNAARDLGLSSIAQYINMLCSQAAAFAVALLGLSAVAGQADLGAHESHSVSKLYGTNGAAPPALDLPIADSGYNRLLPRPAGIYVRAHRNRVWPGATGTPLQGWSLAPAPNLNRPLCAGRLAAGRAACAGYLAANNVSAL